MNGDGHLNFTKAHEGELLTCTRIFRRTDVVLSKLHNNHLEPSTGIFLCTNGLIAWTSLRWRREEEDETPHDWQMFSDAVKRELAKYRNKNLLEFGNVFVLSIFKSIS